MDLGKEGKEIVVEPVPETKPQPKRDPVPA